jgi:hypothetical protein
LNPFGIGIHHEFIARPGEDHDFVLGVGTHGLEHLPNRPVILDAKLDRPAVGVRFHQDHAVGTPSHLVEIFEPLLVLFKLRGRNKLLL